VQKVDHPEDLDRIQNHRKNLFVVEENGLEQDWIRSIRELFPGSWIVLLRHPKHESFGFEGPDFQTKIVSLDSREISEAKLRFFPEYISNLQIRSNLEMEVENLKNDLSGWESIFQESLDLMFLIDPDTKKITQANRTACLILGYAPEDLIGLEFSKLSKSDIESDSIEAKFHGASIINQGLRSVDGTWIPMESTWRPIQKNQKTLILSTFRDISERRTTEEKIHKLAFYNTISDLPNKVFFELQLSDEIRRVDPEKKLSGKLKDSKKDSLPSSSLSNLAVVVFDIDNFKLINESLGPMLGDEILKLVADRIRNLKIKTRFIGHFGGDEFALLLTDFRDEEDLEIQILDIHKELKRPYFWESREFYLTFSLGVSLLARHGETADELIRAADMAMYSAKEHGKNQSIFYSNRLIERAKLRLELETDLRKAIQDGQFLLFFQPQVDLKTKTLSGVEALIRWKHPSRGMISPLLFIPVAEDTGLIQEIGAWVMDEACRIAKRWVDLGYIQFPISVNISARTWRGRQIADQVEKTLAKYRLPERFLVLELTESTIMENPEYSLDMFQELIQRGVSISIDDFGTGYSSLNYLRRLPVHHLKIDGSFIKELVSNENDRTISQTIIAMAHSLGLKVVAEGVENLEQRKLLEKMNCDIIQGYLLSRPLPEKDFEEFLDSFRN
jgi:diguanylate cyclase (GGDEF)-like protein/PAS domain S-box-containing protein